MPRLLSQQGLACPSAHSPWSGCEIPRTKAGGAGGPGRFPERKDTKGEGKSQLKGTMTPTPLHQRLVARCVFILPGSWATSDSILPSHLTVITTHAHLLCGFKIALRSPPQTTAVAVAPRTSPSPLSGASHQDSLSTWTYFRTYFHTRPI